MDKLNSILTFLVGLLVGVLAIGWAQEHRLARHYAATADARYSAVTADFLTLGAALRIAQPDARERALAGAQAVHEQMKRDKGVKQ